MTRVLVTGGAGFIGSHLCKRLVEKGDDVICLDNFFTGNKANITSLLSHKNFELIRHDVTIPIKLEVDQIYHLACPASPIHYQLNGIKTIETMVLGTINMLKLARDTRATILLASTSEVYGDPLEHPQLETYWGNVNPVGPRACYDESKRLAETLFINYYRHEQVDIRIARIFNTFGENMNVGDGRVISNFIVQALKNEDITLYGDGLQTRCFQYVPDLINGLTKLMDRDYTFPLNLGNPVETTMLELAEKILSFLPSSTSKIVYKILPQDDPKRRQPDITLAKAALDWKPVQTLEYGLIQTIAYFKTILQWNALSTRPSHTKY